MFIVNLEDLPLEDFFLRDKTGSRCTSTFTIPECGSVQFPNYALLCDATIIDFNEIRLTVLTRNWGICDLHVSKQVNRLLRTIFKLPRNALAYTWLWPQVCHSFEAFHCITIQTNFWVSDRDPEPPRLQEFFPFLSEFGGAYFTSCSDWLLDFLVWTGSAEELNDQLTLTFLVNNPFSDNTDPLDMNFDVFNSILFGKETFIIPNRNRPDLVNMKNIRTYFKRLHKESLTTRVLDKDKWPKLLPLLSYTTNQGSQVWSSVSDSRFKLKFLLSF
jgi:hypothetical protein